MLISEASITDSFEDPIMSPYPLKVALMHKTNETKKLESTNQLKTSENHKTKYSRTCSKILRHVDTEGGGLKSYYIKNDAIFKPGQRSYLEARRIALYIRSLRRHYADHGIIHSYAPNIPYILHQLHQLLHIWKYCIEKPKLPVVTAKSYNGGS